MALLSSIWAVFSGWGLSDQIACVNCLLTGFFLIATVVSVICAFKAYKHQKDRARKETACNLARYYSENIIMRYSFVTSVMTLADLETQTKDLFPYDELLEFNQVEMLSFLEKKELSYERARNLFLDIDPQAILNAKIHFATSMQEKRHILQDYLVTNEETGEKYICYGEGLQSEFLESVYNFLNDLEWFSMSCRYGISDEEILYQSLHTTFLSTVWLLYFYICNRNITNEDKLFTNIIWLFSQWRSRLRNIQKTAEKKRSKAEKKLKAAEQELIHAKPEVHSGKALKK